MAGLSKLHQALNWLQPESVKHPNHGRWSALHDQLALAVACLSSTRLSADCPGTCALCCVTLSHQSVEEESLLSVAGTLMGRAAFRQEMLGRHGTLVTLAQDRCQGSLDSSIAYIRERLVEAATDMGPTKPIGR
ncbi:hypothetical protein ABBQ32_004994 [Trebouxia sp. C0010 RCD-2024]